MAARNNTLKSLRTSFLKNRGWGKSQELDPLTWSISMFGPAMARFSPNYFAMVMATGILSIACHVSGWGFIAALLLWLNVVFYVALWFLTIGRIISCPNLLLSDLKDHNQGVGYFTIIAGTCILGNPFAILMNPSALGWPIS